MTGCNDLVPTANAFGWTTDIQNPITRKFLDFVSERKSSIVIDIGAGFGVASLPAMQAFVIVNDISQQHLEHVGKRAENEGYASNVLHFLSGAEIVAATKWMFRSTMPGGALFIQTMSPFVGHFRDFLPVYMKRKIAGLEWPGEINGAKSFVLSSLRHMTPDLIHVMEKDILAKAFAAAGFQIAFCDYYTRPALPEECHFDGRENLGMIAHKSS